MNTDELKKRISGKTAGGKIDYLISALAQAQAALVRVTDDLATERERVRSSESAMYGVLVLALPFIPVGKVRDLCLSLRDRLNPLTETAPTPNARSEKEADHD